MNLEAAQKQLADLLEPLIEESKQSGTRMILNMTDSAENYRPLAESMAQGLLAEALSNGISSIETRATLSELGGGAASDFVFRALSNVSMIIKVQRDVKLKNEAIFLRSLQPDVPSATAWGTLFPRVLAMKVDSKPYAYAMEEFRLEEGYKDLSKWIFDDKLLPDARIAQSKSLLDAVLKRLSSVYLESRDMNSKPSLDGEAYLGRIQSRMSEAEGLYAGFKAENVVAGGTPISSWRAQLDEIAKKRSKADALLPSFQTAVHGDSHPGNIMIRLDSEGKGEYRTEIRLIDPRGWHLGDYVFDLAKLAHLLILVGPFERWLVGSESDYTIGGKALRVGPLPVIPSWLFDLEKMVRDTVTSLGAEMKDPGALARYELAMASCFLGSIPVRWKKGQEKLVVLMYVEGLRWLEKFRIRLE